MKKIFLFLILFSFTTVYSQVNKFGIPFITNYSTQDYNASEQNWAIVQDDRGVMYFGNNDDGVLEYDGKNWREIPIANKSIVRSLGIDSKGTIYVGAVGEFGFLEPDFNGNLVYKSLIPFLDSSELDFEDVWKTYVISDTVYFCSYSKIFKFSQPNSFSIISFDIEGSKFTFHVDSLLFHENINQGLSIFKNEKFQLLNQGDFFSHEAQKDVFFMSKLDKNILLISTIAKGIYAYDLSRNELTVNYFSDQLNSTLSSSFIYNGALLKNYDNALASITNGCFIINNRGSLLHHINDQFGLQDNTIACAYYNTRSDNFEPLWMGLNNGISKVEINSPIRFFDESFGLKGSIYDVVRFNNKLYVSTSNGLFYLDYDINGYPSFVSVDELNAEIWSLLVLNESQLLAGTSTGLKLISPNNRIQQVGDQYYVYKLFASDQFPDKIFVGHKKGLLIADIVNNQIILNNTIPLTNAEIRSIDVDSNNNIWLGTYFNGLIRVNLSENDTVVDRFGLEHGLPSVYDILVFSDNGKIRFGTEYGIYEYVEFSNNFTPSSDYPTIMTDGSTGVFRFRKDQKNNGWYSLFNSEKKWIVKVSDKQGEKIIFEDPFKRFPNEQFDVIYHDANEITWFGSSSGLYSFNNSYQKNYNLPFNSLIRKVIIQNDSVIFNGTNFSETDSLRFVDVNQPNKLKLQLAYMFNDVTFYFAAPFFEAEKSLLYSYKLLGYKDSWSNWNTEDKAVFTNLHEGKYTFQVKAKNIYDKESTVAEYSFTLNPPWYRTIVAYIVYGLLILFSVYIIVKLYTRKLELEKIRLEGIVRERTAEIRKKNELLENKNEEITKQRDQIVHQKEQITDSIKYAQRIQKAVVPSQEREDELLKEHFLLWRPRDIVSGDFWWMTEKDNKVILAAADCTGHGVPGAFMSMLGVSFLNEIVNKLKVAEANIILNELRNSVKTTMQQTGKQDEAKDGMDIALVIIDYENMTLQYSGAYNPLYLFREGELFETKADKNPIGIYIKEKDSFTKHDFDLKKGDTIYIFSDGYVDQFGGERMDKFKSKNFKQLLLDNQHLPMKEQKDLLNNTIEAWRGDTEQIDDIIVIGVRF